ncbi:MAG: preprotein translocase subunit SecG [Alphaproteobacteria bacterium]
MATILLIVHLLLALGIVGVVLLQRSEGGGLGIGGGGSGGGMGGLIGNRATANLLTRATAVLAGLFFVSSIALSILSGTQPATRSIIGDVAPAEEALPPTHETPEPAATPEGPVEPSVPLDD